MPSNRWTWALAAGILLFSRPAAVAAEEPQPPPASVTEHVEVTATRIPEDPAEVPASISVMSGQDLRDRGATDLRSALFLLAGVDIAPGGDGGPAGSVPGLWGLKEFDAFLLVVDGVPYGGAFNPALATLTLEDVDRIEVLRGPAPVMYGATSFVGVIQVIRAGTSRPAVGFSGGSYGSGSLTYATPLPTVARFESSVSAGASRTGFRDDRTQFDRSHATWRGRLPAAGGAFRFGVDGVWVQQNPASPHPREGPQLSPAVPVDANHNPAGAYLNEARATLLAAYDRKAWDGTWSTSLSVSQSNQSTLRGFLFEVSESNPTNANGFREAIHVTDVYFDSHMSRALGSKTRFVAGVDHLFGRGVGKGGDFDYFVPLDGSNPPSGGTLAPASDVRIADRRSFSGLYANLEWTPHPDWRVDVGCRLNRTAEERDTQSVEFSSGGTTTGRDTEYVVRGGGSLGLVYTPWRRNADAVRVFAAYRNTFKPAAIDFGIDAEAEILAPETAQAYEAGVKTSFLDNSLTAELAAYQMDFRNLVVAGSVGGVPTLVNAGAERFRGAELSVGYAFRKELKGFLAYSLHDNRFRDFVMEFDPGVPTQLRGKRLEMAPRDLASLGLVYAPGIGWHASAEASWVGERFLNKRNTAPASDYITWSAGVGYRFRRFELRADGRNLNDQRPPVAESELGDAQYYRLPARSVAISARWNL